MALPTAYHALGEGRYLERFGLAFEEFSPGQRFAHRPGITLSQQDNCDETLDSANGAMVHFDAQYAAAAGWPQPLMVSTLTLQRLLGLCGKTLGRRGDLRRLERIALTAPLFGGDTIYAESEVLACEDTADPGFGHLRLRTIGRKVGPGERLAADGGQPFADIVYEVAMPRAAPITWQGQRASPAMEPRFASHREEDGRLVEQWGLYFDDTEPGERFVHWPRRSFERQDVVQHSRRAFELAARHHDEGWRGAQSPPRLRVPETMLIGAVTALTTRTFGRVVANLGWTDVELAPVFEADTIEAESTIVGKRASKSRPGQGVLTVDTVARNQHGDEVCSYRRVLLVYARGGEAPYGPAGY